MNESLGVNLALHLVYDFAIRTYRGTAGINSTTGTVPLNDVHCEITCSYEDPG
jgi:hypothetical protein